MKTVITTLLLLCTLTSCGQENNSTSDRQSIIWGGKAAVGSYAPEGTLSIKNINADIEGSIIKTLTVVIDMKSLNQENKRLTKHLRDKDFFYVKKYPEARFELTEAFIIGESKILKGTMTIKDETQEEQLPVTATIENGVVRLVFNHTMNRLDYGITFNSPTVFEKIKENAIADEITLKGSIKIKIK